MTTYIYVDIDNVEIFRQGDHVEAAAPTHGGACPYCPTQIVTTPWDVVDNGVIRGTFSGQCGGCGQLGEGWVLTGARPLPVHPLDHAEFVEALKVECAGLRDGQYAVNRSEIRADLAPRLVDAIATKPAHPYAEDDQEWDDWIDRHDVTPWGNIDADTHATIVLADDGSVSAWFADPATGEGIEFTADDLTKTAL